MNRRPHQITLSAVFLALALILPFFTGQIPQFGQMLLPMHLPVLICGFVCGWRQGLLVGFLAPLLRSAVFGMPPLYPTAVAMAFELATYGTVTGLLQARLPRSTASLLASLVAAMLAGRIAWAAATFALTGALTLELFLAAAFLNAWPGIVLQLLLVPPVVAGIARLVQEEPAMRGSPRR
ncbi:ECF transporter S component [Symbiobacterium thermophilum]|uniref:ECF transporter S component n=1 Tax=Symbiobacterium thermophilum TaxID=2734 RepID=A0A953LG76_SYMTR|nr:ECF transporter S component [Symbiobacterium thermophilum]MBY6274971.1 ECF transporter S component [Symbiobacterium thermophilum]